jgi:hypothetical protein
MNTPKKYPPINSLDTGGKKKDIENVHHIIPKSQGGTNTSDNLVQLFQKKHNALHTLFDVLTPVQQQLFLLLKINNKVHTRRFLRDAEDLLTQDDESYYYKDGVYRPKK